MTRVTDSIKFKCRQCSEEDCWTPIFVCLSCGQMHKMNPPKFSDLTVSEEKLVRELMNSLELKENQ